MNLTDICQLKRVGNVFLLQYSLAERKSRNTAIYTIFTRRFACGIEISLYSKFCHTCGNILVPVAKREYLDCVELTNEINILINSHHLILRR